MTIGRYRVIQQLGRGAMGRVWEVEDLDGQHYALKLPDSVVGSDAAMRLAREANALRLLSHENLVAAVDVFTDRPFLCTVTCRSAPTNVAFRRLDLAGSVVS